MGLATAQRFVAEGAYVFITSRRHEMFDVAVEKKKTHLPLVTKKEFDDTFNVNVKSVLFTVRQALPIFNNGDSIILACSIADGKGRPGKSVYSASKAAIQSFARCWTVDLKERKTRINVLSPGPIEMALRHHAAGEGKQA